MHNLTPNNYAFQAGYLNLSYICDLIPETIEDQHSKKVPETIEDQNSEKMLGIESGYPGTPQHQNPEFQAKFQHMLLPRVEK